VPEPPDPAYQQILKGIPAADFSAEELLYLPRNPRAHRRVSLVARLTWLTNGETGTEKA
jgi:hypothetical protein